MTIERFRTLELWGLSLLTAIYLLIAVSTDYSQYINVLRVINADEERRIFLNYNWWLNGFLPFLNLGIGVWSCWFIQSQYVVRLWQRDEQLKALLAFTAAGIVLLAGVWSYLFLHDELEFRHDKNYNIIGAKLYNLFRLRNVAMISSGLFISTSIYVTLSQLYQWVLQHQPDEENALTHRIIRDGSVLALAGFVAFSSFQILTKDLFLIPGFIWVIGSYLHAYLYHHHFLRWRGFRFYRYPESRAALQKAIILYGASLVASFVGNLVYTLFKIHNPYMVYPVQADEVFLLSLIAWIGAIVVTIMRQVMVKPLETSLNRNQAELSALRAQINPHFLFNAMNTLYATSIEENAERTSQGIQQLSDMMRFMMHENNQDQIDIRQEVQYLRNYVDLQRLRISESDKFELKIELDDSLCLRSVAPMMLIPFVENAFKHGVSLRNHSWIFVKLYCDTEKLHFTVNNSLHPRNDQDPEKYSSGIGLVNVRKRLELLYPNRHHLLIHQTEKEFSVSLEIAINSKKIRTKKASRVAGLFSFLA
ncbi:MAG: histidine kinase [Bacteroidetes bacterium]|nr:histidine kinase [Bacteroidota bacterium]